MSKTAEQIFWEAALAGYVPDFRSTSLRTLCGKAVAVSAEI